MKKRWLAGAALTLSMALVAAGCSDNANENAATNTDDERLEVPTFEAGTKMAEIQQSGTLDIGIKYDQPGFGLKNPTNNDIEGFDVEIAELIAQGIFGGTKQEAAGKVNYVEAVSKNREPFIQDGRVDMVVATYTINDTRKQVIEFAGPYYVAHGDIMVRNDNNTIKSVTDLNGKQVCTARGSTYPASLRSQAPQATVVELDTYSQCAEALRDNRVEAVTTDNVILAGLVQSNNGAFKLVNTSYTDEPYGIGVQKGNDAFVKFINDRLQTIFDNGQWKAAFERTLGELGLPIPEPPELDRYLEETTTTTTAAGARSATSTTAAGGNVTTTTTTSTTSSTTTTTTAANVTVTTR